MDDPTGEGIFGPYWPENAVCTLFTTVLPVPEARLSRLIRRRGQNGQDLGPPISHLFFAKEVPFFKYRFTDRSGSEKVSFSPRRLAVVFQFDLGKIAVIVGSD